MSNTQSNAVNTKRLKGLLIANIIVIAINLPWIIVFGLIYLPSETLAPNHPLYELVFLLSFLSGFGMIVMALAGIFGLISFFIAVKNWRTITTVYKSWFVVIACLGLLLGITAAMPFITNSLAVQKVSQQWDTRIQESYISYDTAREEIMACHIENITIQDLSNKKDGQYLQLTTRWDYKTYGTRFDSTSASTGGIVDQNGDPINLYLPIKYKQDTKADLEESNKTCSPETVFYDR